MTEMAKPANGSRTGFRAVKMTPRVIFTVLRLLFGLPSSAGSSRRRTMLKTSRRSAAGTRSFSLIGHKQGLQIYFRIRWRRSIVPS